MKKIKTDKNTLVKIGREFNAETLRGMNLLHDRINDLIEGKLDKSRMIDVIQSEHIGDRIKDRYIDLLYKDRRALPFLVEDRFRIMKYLDVIADTSEDVAYIIKIFPYDNIYDDIKENMKILNGIYKESVELLISMVELMETDFKTAFQKSFNMETLKRTGRDYKYKILEVLYKKEADKSLKVYLISKVSIKLYDMIQKAEEISDFLRSLIVKYPSK